MNKKLLIICMALLSVTLCMAEKAKNHESISVTDAFINMPEGVMDILSKDSRATMIDQFEMDSIKEIINDFQGISTIDTIADDYMAVQLSNASSIQLKVLKKKNGEEILMTIYTTGNKNESLDSDVMFYDAQLNPLPKKDYFQTPKLSDFFNTKGYKTKMKEIEEILPFYTILFEATPENSNLRGKLTYSDRLTIEDAKILELLLKPDVIFVWDGNKFKLSK